ncbi:MAG: IS110 family transposase [Planctomycetota bacterium]|nr:IS110 family transposase [Planctomycetota bacterium]
MEALHRCCAGLDVHKQTIHVCIRRLADGGKVTAETRVFSSMTPHILALADWLAAEGVTHVAMESTGVYWKPIWNLLEGRFDLLLCNAREIKQVPGRKTDVKDCQWLAQLLQYGLLKASFVPPRPLRELRDLTRQRVQLVNERTAVANRVQKVLEDANIKLSSVASDILGRSGRAMIRALIAGEQDPQRLADLAQRRLREKMPQLIEALQGHVDEHHRFMLRLHFEHLGHLEQMVAQLEERIDQVLQSPTLTASQQGADALPFPEAVALLVTIPGVDQCSAKAILAETGTDMGRFPDAAHLASWTGICSGNHESAGKRRSGRIAHGNRWLRRALTQAAWAASHTKHTYLSAYFRRLAGRRGKKRALIALAHSLLVTIYYMLRDGQSYQDLGADYLDRLHPERLAKGLVRRLQKLGYAVELTAAAEAA